MVELIVLIWTLGLGGVIVMLLARCGEVTREYRELDHSARDLMRAHNELAYEYCQLKDRYDTTVSAATAALSKASQSGARLDSKPRALKLLAMANNPNSHEGRVALNKLKELIEREL